MSEGKKIDDGGPAFPAAVAMRLADGQPMTGHDFGCGGMTLREYYAGQAMAGMCSTSQNNDDIEYAARAAVRCADALISALKVTP